MIRESISSVNTFWYRCPKCDKSFFVKKEDPQKHLLKRTMRCPNHVRCKGRISNKSFNSASEVRNYITVTAVELYQASAGLGLISERDCSPTTVTKLLQGSRILAAELQDAEDPNKSILLSLTMENGRILHLAASINGAIIYKVTKASYGG